MPEGHDGGLDVFLSYARDDDPDFRDAVVAGLGRAGLRVWIDRASMPNRGTTFGQEIRRAIESSGRLLLLWGPSAAASGYVAQEWGYADDVGKPVVPVIREGTFRSLPDRLRHYHGVDGRGRDVDTIVADLVRLLGEPVQPLGPCFSVPSPPPHALERPDLVERLFRTVLPDRMRPEDAGRVPRITVLYGVAGVGKSTVTGAFASATRTRRVFPDGVVWLPGGPGFEPLAAARELLRLAAPGARLPERDGEIANALSCLAGRELLIVLDDVRDPDLAAPFLAAAGPGARILVTTLDQAVATALGAIEIPVETLDDAAARALLSGWAGDPLPAEADRVLAACDGLPFALAIVGAMIANRTPWDVVAEALDERRLDLLEGRFPAYPHRTVLRVLIASFESLEADDPRAAQCYLELAGLRPGAVLSRAVLLRLWSRPGRLSTLEAGLVLPILERRLLLQAVSDGFALHKLHEDFVRLRHPDPGALTAALVSSYRADGVAWAELDDDGYLFDQFVAHLAELDDPGTVFEIVSRAWVQRQWQRTGDLAQALADVRTAIGLAIRPPVDLATIVRLSILSGQIMATLRGAPPLFAALAAVGDLDAALHWSADHPDASERFFALTEIAAAASANGEMTLARRVCRVAAETIPLMGETEESGSVLPGLVTLNAVHAIVHFPEPDQWEGTTEENVATALVPLDALVELAPLAHASGAITALLPVRHPAWEPYSHLLPLAAVERLALQGDTEVAQALLDVYPELSGDEDFQHAAAYLSAVALAALGRFGEARAAIDALPRQYQGVGLRGLGRNLAWAGRSPELIEILPEITDATVLEETLDDAVEAALERATREECLALVPVVEGRGWRLASALLHAAAGDPEPGLRLAEAGARSDDGEEIFKALDVGTQIGWIHRRLGAMDAARAIVRALRPIADQHVELWWAPAWLDRQPEVTRMAQSFTGLAIAMGEPLPEELGGQMAGIEHHAQGVPEFKLTLIKELALADRVDEALELAEEGIWPGSKALGLAAALAGLGAADTERIRGVAGALAEELPARPPGPRLDQLLSESFFTHGLGGPLAVLSSAADGRIDLPLTLATRALLQAKDGEAEQVRRLARQTLADRPLETPHPAARAVMLCAVAAARAEPSSELDAAVTLLTEPATAAWAFDVLAEVITLKARHGSARDAAELARSLPSGQVPELADGLSMDGVFEHPIEISAMEIAAAAATRAVAFSAMALASPQDAADWLDEAETYLRKAEWIVLQQTNAETATARYLWSARAVAGHSAVPPEPALAAAVAWWLWDQGLHDVACRYARDVADGLTDPFVEAWTNEGSSPVFIDAEDYLFDGQRRTAVKASMTALQVLAAHAEGDGATAASLAATFELDALAGMPSLSFAERCETFGRVAIALWRAGAREKSQEMLRMALSYSMTLADRGEHLAFAVLCQAIIEILPSETAAEIWARWLQVAAGTGSYSPLVLVGCYLRHLPAAALAPLSVNPETGDLEPR